jgi:hypothetical protein
LAVINTLVINFILLKPGDSLGENKGYSTVEIDGILCWPENEPGLMDCRLLS